SKQAAVANAWKKWQGELKGLIRLKTVEKKQAQEAQFAAWAADKPEYNTLLPRFAEYYKAWQEYALVRDYQTEAFNAIEIINYVAWFTLFLDEKSAVPDTVLKRRLQARTADFFKDYSPAIDKQIFVALFTEYLQHIPETFVPPALHDENKKYKENVKALSDTLYAHSLFTSQEAVERLLQQDKNEIVQALLHDPLFMCYKKRNDFYRENVEKPYRTLQAQIDALYHDYMRGLMAFQPGRDFYPDANSTLRIAYGKVAGYSPVNAVYYLPQSTIEGIMEKDNPDIYDYDIPQQLREVVAAKDYGRWAENGTIPVAFIATNHTTGGNSGSPVLNGNGELIGINFDRTWESTMSDVEYDPEICRNIAVDIRYVLFVIDKIAGAGYLLDEMNFAI
ncbi:MAG: S46 family peptidase, partial [Prevotellaceae bacterium]|nr:S46 family peptidase [Prevotellaceae bacterium]